MKEKLLEILTDACPGVDFETETALIDDGLLESLDLVTIVAELMDAFDGEITGEDLLPENFNSADDMLAMLRRKLD